MTINSIPQIGHPVTGNFRIDPTWYRFLRELDRETRDAGADFTAEIEALARKLGSPDGTIAGIPAPSDNETQVQATAPILAAGNRVSLATVTQEISGELQGFALDAFGRAIGSRPVVAGPGIIIDGTTDPDQIEVSYDNPMTALGDLIRADTGGTPERLPVGTDGQVLTVVAGEPEWQTAVGLTNPMTTAEDLIKGGASGTPARLAVGSNGQVLTVTAGAVGWATPASGGAVPVQEEGTTVVATPTAINFVGAGVTATASGSVATVTIPGGGADPWTYVVLSSDFSTSTAADVTGFEVTPVANKVIIVECGLLIETTLATTGPRPIVQWPTTIDNGISRISVAQATNSDSILSGNSSATQTSSATAMPLANASYPGEILITMVCGASPVGTLKIRLQSETANLVTFKTGSWMRYRTIN